MYFEELVFFSLLGFFFFLYGYQKPSFAFAFSGAIIILVIGATMNLQGTQQDYVRIVDMNSSTKDVTFYPTYQKNVLTIGLGTLFLFLGIAGLILSTAKVAENRKKEWNG